MHFDWTINVPLLMTGITGIVSVLIRLVRLEDGQKTMGEQAKSHEAEDERRFEKLDNRLQLGSDRFRDHGERIAKLEAAKQR